MLGRAKTNYRALTELIPQRSRSFSGDDGPRYGSIHSDTDGFTEVGGNQLVVV